MRSRSGAAGAGAGDQAGRRIRSDDRYCWQTATISPISFQLDGIYGSGETSNEAVSITLKDRTSFALSSAENDYEDSPYGTYGSWGSSYAGSWESGDVKETWPFSRLIDLADLALHQPSTA
ncbi:MAG: hypothetical protein ACLU3I_04470 [Acutalibacteraceae bacterium]